MKGTACFQDFPMQIQRGLKIGNDLGGMKLFGVCPNNPEECNQEQGRENYREGENIYHVSDGREDCSDQGESGVGGDIDRDMQDRIDQNQRAQESMIGRENPCALPEEKNGSNAATSEAAGRMPDRSYASSGGGSTQAERGETEKVGIVKFFAKTYKTDEGSFSVSYQERTYEDGSKDVIDYHITPSKDTGSDQGETSERVRAIEADKKAIQDQIDAAMKDESLTGEERKKEYNELSAERDRLDKELRDEKEKLHDDCVAMSGDNCVLALFPIKVHRDWLVLQTYQGRL